MSHFADGPQRAAKQPPRRAAPKEKKERTPLQKAGLWLGEFFLYVVILLVVMSLVRVFLIQPFKVPSGSMEQTVKVNETIVVWKPAKLVRGEIVVFRDDLNWLTPAQPATWWQKSLSFIGLAPPTDEQFLVKRLIGLPGDHVTCCNAEGKIEVNGYALDEESYLYAPSPGRTVQPSVKEFDIVVPEGHIFVLGDHRDESADSREHMCDRSYPDEETPDLTFPSVDAVQGRVFAVSRPLSSMRTFSIPDTFDKVPPPDPTISPPSVDTAQWTCPLSLVDG